MRETASVATALGGRRAQAQRRDALERLGQSLADLSDDIVDGHLDALQLELAVEASIERAYLAEQRDAGRIAPDDEHGRAGLAARIVGHLRHRKQQIGLGPAGHERLDSRDGKRVAPSHRHGARPLACVGEGQRGRQLAAEDGQEKALTLSAGRQAQEPAVSAEDEASQRALRAGDLLVERDQPHRPETAASQLGGLGEPEEAGLGRASPRPTPERRARLRLVGDALPRRGGLELFGDEGAQALPKRADLRRQGDRVRDPARHDEASAREAAASGPSAMQANATFAAVGTPNRAVCRAGNPPGKCLTYSEEPAAMRIRSTFSSAQRVCWAAVPSRAAPPVSLPAPVPETKTSPAARVARENAPGAGASGGFRNSITCGV